MTRERKSKESLAKASKVLGLGLFLFVLPTAIFTSSSDHSYWNKLSWKDLKPKTPSRCIASLEEICEREERIESLKADIEKLEAEKEKVFKTLKDALAKKEEEEKEETSSDDKPRLKDYTANKIPEGVLQQFLLAQHYSQVLASMPAQWANLNAKPMGYFDPISNPTQQSRYDYLQMAMMNRWSFMMDEQNSWHPQWDQNGDMTNNLYGGPQTWGDIRTMYRTPTLDMRGPSSRMFPF